MITTGIEFKILLAGLKYLFIGLSVWFLEPIYDFIILQQVVDYAILSPYMKEFLNDIKILLGVLVAFLLAVRYFYVILKIKKETKK